MSAISIFVHLAGSREKFGILRALKGAEKQTRRLSCDKSILSLGLEHLYFPQFACWENHFSIPDFGEGDRMTVEFLSVASVRSKS